MNIVVRELNPNMADDYIDFFEQRAFSDGSPDKGCYCVWHHWTQKHESDRSKLPANERHFSKRNYAVELIKNNIMHGFVAYDEDRMVGFCNANLKDHYFRLNRENEKIFAMVCFTVDPDCRGKGIAKKLLEYACEYTQKNGYDYIESYPANGEFKTTNCCGNRSMYEALGFEIICNKDGIIARKKCRE